MMFGSATSPDFPWLGIPGRTGGHDTAHNIITDKYYEPATVFRRKSRKRVAGPSTSAMIDD